MATLKTIRERTFSQRIFSTSPLRNFFIRTFAGGVIPEPPVETFYLINNDANRFITNNNDKLIYGNT